MMQWTALILVVVTLGAYLFGYCFRHGWLTASRQFLSRGIKNNLNQENTHE